MPIVLTPDTQAPLEQGDVLRGVVTYFTAEDGNPKTDEPPYVLVLSRPCNAFRDERIVVADAFPFNIEVESNQTADQLRRFLTGIRDGRTKPDHFYLGELPHLEGQATRFTAHLDALHTISVPGVGPSRVEFTHKRRAFRLAPDFVRDLHARIFGAFASLGFNDDQWYSDQDLALLLAHAKADAHKLEGTLAEVEKNLEVEKTKGPLTPEPKSGKKYFGVLDGFMKQIENRKEEVAKARELVARLESEQHRRLGSEGSLGR